MNREELNFYFQYVNRKKIQKFVDYVKKTEKVDVIIEPQECSLTISVKDSMGKIAFDSGNILVIQCCVEVNGIKCWAVIQELDPKLSELIAICDACAAQKIYLSDIKYLFYRTKRKIDKKLKNEKNMINDILVNYKLMNLIKNIYILI